MVAELGGCLHVGCTVKCCPGGHQCKSTNGNRSQPGFLGFEKTSHSSRMGISPFFFFFSLDIIEKEKLKLFLLYPAGNPLV